MEQIFDRIRAYIDGQRGPMLALWEEIVNIDSGTRQIGGANEVCAVLRREMKKSGIKTHVNPIQNAGDMLVGEWNMGSGKTHLRIIGHMDTVLFHINCSSSHLKIIQEVHSMTRKTAVLL